MLFERPWSRYFFGFPQTWLRAMEASLKGPGPPSKGHTFLVYVFAVQYDGYISELVVS